MGTVAPVRQLRAVVVTRPVLRVELCLDDESMTVTHTAPRYPLVRLLRPGVRLPLLLAPDPGAPAKIDWAAVDPATVPPAEPLAGVPPRRTAQLSAGPDDAAPDPAYGARREAIATSPWTVVAAVGLAALVLAGAALVSRVTFPSAGVLVLILATFVTRQFQDRWVPGVRAHGRPATATVVSSQVPDEAGEELRAVEVVLSVPAPDGPPYEVTISPVMPYHLLAGLRPGATVPVRVDPTKPRRVVIAL